jgi:steroid delta-isomerase
MASRKDIVSACDRYLAAVSAGDVDGIMDVYAAEPNIEDPVGSPLKVGRDAVRAFYEGTTGTSLKLTRIGPVCVAGNQAAFTFRIDVDLGDSTLTLASTDLMTFDDEGKVTAMVAYSDMEAFADEPVT